MKIASKRWVGALMALAIYQAAAILWFGLPVVRDFTRSYIGTNGSADAGLHMWCLAWWPYAISHHLNPFITKAVWAPAGFNLTWATSIPFAALISTPITRLWGPVAAYNVICLAAPALAAWCACILCRHACDSFVPSLVGGYLFGFSPYVLGHLLGGHLALILILPVPLAIYLVALRIEGRIRPVSFTLLFAMVAVVQFLCSTELFATSAFFGGIVMLAAILTARAAMRKALLEASALAVVGLAAAGILLTPFLYYVFFVNFVRGAIFFPGMFSSDLLAFVVPPPTLLVRPPALNSIAARLWGDFVEDTAYIGIPMLLIAIDYGWANRGKPLARLMIAALVVFVLASLGPILHVAGAESITLPWVILNRLPIIDKMLTGRFMMFAYLDLALIAAIYLSTAPHPMRKWVLAALSVVSLLPNLPASAMGHAGRHAAVFQHWRLQALSAQGRNHAGSALRMAVQQHAVAGADEHVLPDGGRLRGPDAGGFPALAGPQQSLPAGTAVGFPRATELLPCRPRRNGDHRRRRWAPALAGYSDAVAPDQDRG